MRGALFSTLAALGLCGAAAAHDAHTHGSPAPSATSATATADNAGSGATGGGAPALPFGTNIGGDFALIDQFGTPRTAASFHGAPVLLFFGYANCEAICSVALPRMAEAVDLLDEGGVTVQPVMITVDPARDTPEAMRTALPAIHPRLTGLTGSAAALDTAYRAWQIETKQVAEDIDGQPVYAHGSYIYLVGSNGDLLTLFPPILGPERMAEIVRGYLAPG